MDFEEYRQCNDGVLQTSSITVYNVPALTGTSGNAFIAGEWTQVAQSHAQQFHDE